MWQKSISTECKHKFAYRTGNSKGAAGLRRGVQTMLSGVSLNHLLSGFLCKLVSFFPWDLAALSLCPYSLWSKRERHSLSQHPHIKSQGSLLGPVWSYAFTNHSGTWGPWGRHEVQAHEVPGLANPGSGVHTCGQKADGALWMTSTVRATGDGLVFQQKKECWTDKSIRRPRQLRVSVIKNISSNLFIC